MFHDRVAFGGVLIAIAVLYLWLTTVPLAAGAAWAWWTILVSGAAASPASSPISATATWTAGTGSTAFLAPLFAAGVKRWPPAVRRRPVDATAPCSAGPGDRRGRSGGPACWWPTGLRMLLAG